MDSPLRDMELTKDKWKAIRLFALVNGWNKAWLVDQQEAMEHLYGRKLSIMEAAAESLRYTHWPMDDKDCLNHEFLKAFFKAFPKVEIRTIPPVSLGYSHEMSISPTVLEKNRYEEAWKYHIQAMVMMEKAEERIDYLYKKVPESVKEELENHDKKRRERVSELSK